MTHTKPQPPKSWQRLANADAVEHLAFVLGLTVEIDPKYDVLVTETDAATYWAPRAEVSA